MGDMRFDFDPHQESQIASELIKKREYAHAAVHLAYALAANPTDTHLLGMLDRILQTERRILDKLEPDQHGGMHYSHAALRAYILAKHGEINDSISLIGQVHSTIPANLYLSWVSDWIEKPPSQGLLRRSIALDPDVIAQYLSRDMSKYSGTQKVINSEDRALYQRMIPTLKKLRNQHAQHVALLSVSSSMLRRIGEFDLALDFATSGYEIQPSYITAIMIGYVYREFDDIENAQAWYDRSLEHKPDDISVRLDLGDMLCSVGQYETGLPYYQKAIQLDPDNIWATSHFFYFSYRMSEDPIWVERLQAFAEKHNEDIVVSLNNDLQRRINVKPYLNLLPTPEEAILSFPRQFDQMANVPRPSGNGPFQLKIGSSALEAPSAVTCVRRFFTEMFGETDLKIALAEIQQPDPRQPTGHVAYTLWHYEGTDPRPNLPSPSQEIKDEIAKTITLPYDASAWWQISKRVASRLDTDQIPELLAVMTEPPLHPDGISIWDWMLHVQVMVALILANIDSGWEGSQRKVALTALVQGQMDWTIIAGLVALEQVAKEETALVPKIIDLFRHVYDNIPNVGYTPYARCLVECGLRLPNLPEDLKNNFKDIRKDLS